MPAAAAGLERRARGRALCPAIQRPPSRVSASSWTGQLAGTTTPVMRRAAGPRRPRRAAARRPAGAQGSAGRAHRRAAGRARPLRRPRSRSGRCTARRSPGRRPPGRRAGAARSRSRRSARARCARRERHRGALGLGERLGDALALLGQCRPAAVSARVRPPPRCARSTRLSPVSASSRVRCWDTADGLRYRARAAGTHAAGALHGAQAPAGGGGRSSFSETESQCASKSISCNELASRYNSVHGHDAHRVRRRPRRAR